MNKWNGQSLNPRKSRKFSQIVIYHHKICRDCHRAPHLKPLRYLSRTQRDQKQNLRLQQCRSRPSITQWVHRTPNTKTIGSISNRLTSLIMHLARMILSSCREALTDQERSPYLISQTSNKKCRASCKHYSCKTLMPTTNYWT